MLGPGWLLSLIVALSPLQVVCSLRNPRDVMISSYHFDKGFKELKDRGTVEEFMERFLSEEVSSMAAFRYKGLIFTHQFHSVESLSYVENEFQLLDDDVVIITYPKSGSLRNPRDVMVSSYHFIKGFKGLKDPETMEEYMERFLSGEVGSGSWFDHVKGWVEMKERENIFFITYEELQQDLRGGVQKICPFLGKELNSQQMESVVENASFQKMKDNTMSNFSLAPESVFDHTKAKFMRKGISGDWKNHLTVAQSKHFDSVYQEKMRGVKMTFPWD